MYDLEDLLRAQRLGSTLGDATKAGTNLYGPLADAPEIFKEAFTMQQRDLRRMGEATQARIDATIAAGGYMPTDGITGQYSLFGTFLSLLRFLVVCVGVLLLLFAAIVAVGVVTAPDHSHVDVEALRNAKVDRAFYAPVDPRVQKLAALPITTIRRQHVDSSYVRPGGTATEQQLVAGHAIWLRYLDNPEGYGKLDIIMRDGADRLVSAYLSHLAAETGSVQPLVDLGNERPRLNPWGVSGKRTWQRLALASPHDPVLEALATRSDGRAIPLYEHRFERGLKYLLSLVGLDDHLAAWL